MRINSLIKYLEKVKAKYGNIEVCVPKEDEFGEFDFSVSPIQAEGVSIVHFEDRVNNSKVLLLTDQDSDSPVIPEHLLPL